MRVFIVIDNAPERHVRQVFSSEQKAKNYIIQDTNLNDGITTCYIEEHTSDVGMSVIPREIKGEAFIRFVDKWDLENEKWVKTNPGAVCDSSVHVGGKRLAKPGDTYDYVGYNYKNEGVKVFSFESQEHARNICKQLYKDYLRIREETPPIF